MLPILLIIIGMCVDFGIMVLNSTKLAAAVKFAAISATSDLDSNNEIMAEWSYVESVLQENLDGAVLVGFQINPHKMNECTVEATITIPYYFMKVFHFENKTLYECYTAERSRD